MGVMACSRGNCGNILCDRYSCEHGYICEDCFEDLIRRGVRTDIEEFMRSDNISYDERDSALVYFNTVFRNARDEQ